MIKWQESLQLRTTKSTTVEFMLRVGEEEELVKNPFTRLAHYEASGATPATGWSNWTLRTPGVYVYDQTILSNNHIMEQGILAKNGTAVPVASYDLNGYRVSTANNFDVFPLTTLAIGFNSSEIFCEFTMLALTTHEYWRCEKLSYSLSSYVPGTIYHVAVVHDHSLGQVFLYVDGTLRDTFTLHSSYVFAGEEDEINKVVYATGQKRDVVILNECTARASYQSACKFDSYNHGFQTFHHGFGATGGTDDLVPWCCSPPRGTAMWDLRVWDEARSSANVSAWKNKRILKTDSNPNLACNWHLNDGGPVCENQVTGSERDYCTIHHGYPGYVNHSELLHGIGLMLRDGQHVIRSFNETDRDIGLGIQDKLGTVFDEQSPGSAYLEHQDTNDFTVQIQFTVPDALQVELNDQDASATGGAAVVSYDIRGLETRRPIFSALANGYHLHDGRADTYSGSTARRIATYYTRATTGAHMAYDQTLFSIEGVQNKDSASTTSLCNEADRRRIPVARGLLTPSGKVVFELFKDDYGGSVPLYCRLVSTSTLVAGNTYTVTFVQRAKHAWTGGAAGQTLNASGWDMEIWIEDVTAGTPAAKDASSYPMPVEGGAHPATYSCPHRSNYDIIIGASYVNNGWDIGVQRGGVITGGTSYFPTGATGTRRGNHGPW